MNKRQKILIVDDAKFNRDILKEFLGETYDYLEAENGNQAAQIMEENLGIDLILLDINMPQMDIQMPIMNGYKASRRMRELKDGNKSQIPIVAMTANAFEEDKKMALASSMNNHVAKPIDMNVLLPTIMKYM